MTQSRVLSRLPPPRLTGAPSLEQVLARRRSVRRFAANPVSSQELSQLLWAAQGITDVGEGLRAAPSAGALYPLELYVVMSQGLFHYDAEAHGMEQIRRGDMRPQLSAAALHQDCVLHAPAVVVITGVSGRSAWKYGTRAQRYVYMEAGHVAQNLLLQAVALGLTAVPVGAFDDEEVRQTLGLPEPEDPLYLIPVGRPVSKGL